MLINLIKNAFKFTSAGGKITVQVAYHSRTRCLVLHVKDTGAGMTKEEIGTLFSRFGKLHRTTEMNHEGIGLGLTIVKNIVEQSKGMVSAHSDGPGKGSNFCCSFQVSKANIKVES